MDSYLKIAEQVLRAARRPLGPRAILNAAYLSELVPPSLYGKTQHKTLQARLSEDILFNRERSAFFRCAPGKFFLRELMHDPTLPVEYRTPIVARRRARELKTPAALAFKLSDLTAQPSQSRALDSSLIYGLIEDGRYSYVDPTSPPSDSAVVWSFVFVLRSCEVLTYRLGRYRETRDSFFNHRSLGFFSLVSQQDSSLFDALDAGICSSGLRAAKMDLDILFDCPGDPMPTSLSRTPEFVLAPQAPDAHPCLLSLVPFDCPIWFEPTKRRLAINDLSWMGLESPPNNLEDFEPWSRQVVGNVRAIAMDGVGRK